MILLALIGFCQVRAQQPQQIDLNPHLPFAEQPNPDSKAMQSQVETQERNVNIGGVQYRQITYAGENFLVNAREPETSVNCQMVQMPAQSYAIDGKVAITKRTQFFIESLRQNCDPKANMVHTSKNVRDSNVGVTFDGNKPDDSQQKVFINPIRRLGGFGTTF